MEVILKEDVKKIGKAGDVVKVSDGYARNYLIPQKKAIPITEKNIKIIQESIKKKEKKKQKEKENAKQIIEKLKNVEITLRKLASEDDKLFGSVTEKDIVDKLKEKGIEIEKNNVILEKHIKELGVFNVKIKLPYGYDTKIKVWVVKDNK